MQKISQFEDVVNPNLFSSRRKRDWLLLFFLTAQVASAIYINLQAQFGESPFGLRSFVGFTLTTIIMVTTTFGTIAFFLRKPWAWLVFAGLAVFRLFTILSYLPSTSHVPVWLHLFFFLEFAAIGLYLYWHPHRQRADA